MRYKVLDRFKAMTKQGELELQPGQVITMPHNIAIKLLNEGKIIPIEKATYKVYSELLGCYLWIVDTDQDMHLLREKGIKEAIYTFEETQRLKGMDKDSLREIHNVKEVFENSKVKK